MSIASFHFIIKTIEAVTGVLWAKESGKKRPTGTCSNPNCLNSNVDLFTFRCSPLLQTHAVVKKKLIARFGKQLSLCKSCWVPVAKCGEIHSDLCYRQRNETAMRADKEATPTWKGNYFSRGGQFKAVVDLSKRIPIWGAKNRFIEENSNEIKILWKWKWKK